MPAGIGTPSLPSLPSTWGSKLQLMQTVSSFGTSKGEGETKAASLAEDGGRLRTRKDRRVRTCCGM